jgi:DNA mismatch repair protein MutS2
MEMEVTIADLAPRAGKKAAAHKTPLRRQEEAAADRINLLGFRVDDALAELERFLNRASLDGLGEVRIVHGKGTGALMRGVRDFLTNHPLVREFRGGEPFEGGDGVTIVTLR